MKLLPPKFNSRERERARGGAELEPRRERVPWGEKRRAQAAAK